MGDYIPKEDVVQYLESWIDSGLDDRDNLRSWSFEVQEVTEEEITEDEYWA